MRLRQKKPLRALLSVSYSMYGGTFGGQARAVRPGSTRERSTSQVLALASADRLVLLKPEQFVQIGIEKHALGIELLANA